MLSFPSPRCRLPSPFAPSLPDADVHRQEQRGFHLPSQTARSSPLGKAPAARESIEETLSDLGENLTGNPVGDPWWKNRWGNRFSRHASPLRGKAPGIENAGSARRFSLVIPPRQQGFSSSAVGKRRFPCGSSLRWKYHPPACHPEFFNGRPTKPGKPVGSLREYLWGTP